MTSEKKDASRFAKFLALFGLAAGTWLCSSGCATVISGTRQDVDIESIPSGAEVYLNGDFAGTTPLTLELMRAEHPLIILKKEGYADTQADLAQDDNGMLAFANILSLIPTLIGPVSFFCLDMRSEATKYYVEDEVLIPLLEKNELSNDLNDGNVMLTNARPSRELVELRDALQQSLRAKIRLHGIYPKKTLPRENMTAGRLPPPSMRDYELTTGTAWVYAEIDENGRISCVESVRAVSPQSRQNLEAAAKTALIACAEDFVAPESSREILPTHLILPVTYTREEQTANRGGRGR